MKDKNVFTFGVLIAVVLIQLYHSYIEIPIAYKVLIDILILVSIPYLYRNIYYYFIELYKKYTSSKSD